MMTYIFLAALMSILARQAGGGLYADWLVYQAGTKINAFAGKVASRLPELLFAAPFAYAVSQFAPDWLVVATFVGTYAAMELGHGNVYRMGGIDGLYIDRPQSIEIPLRPIFQKLFGPNLARPLYSWFIMGAKGLLIGLGALPQGILLTFLWPLSYYFGHRLLKKPQLSEYLSGAFAGLIVAMSL